jgi:hypothetical protein
LVQLQFLNVLLILKLRQFDVGLILPFGPREARPKRRKIVPRAERAERFFAPVEFTLNHLFAVACSPCPQNFPVDTATPTPMEQHQLRIY